MPQNTVILQKFTLDRVADDNLYEFKRTPGEGASHFITVHSFEDTEQRGQKKFLKRKENNYNNNNNFTKKTHSRSTSDF